MRAEFHAMSKKEKEKEKAKERKKKTGWANGWGWRPVLIFIMLLFFSLSLSLAHLFAFADEPFFPRHNGIQVSRLIKSKGDRLKECHSRCSNSFQFRVNSRKPLWCSCWSLCVLLNTSMSPLAQHFQLRERERERMKKEKKKERESNRYSETWKRERNRS